MWSGAFERMETRSTDTLGSEAGCFDQPCKASAGSVNRVHGAFRCAGERVVRMVSAVGRAAAEPSKRRVSIRAALSIREVACAERSAEEQCVLPFAPKAWLDATHQRAPRQIESGDRDIIPENIIVHRKNNAALRWYAGLFSGGT